MQPLSFIFCFLSLASCAQLASELSEHMFWTPKPSKEFVEAFIDHRSVPNEHGLDSLSHYLLNRKATFDSSLAALLVDEEKNSLTNLCSAVASGSFDKLSFVVKAYNLPTSILGGAGPAYMSPMNLLSHIFRDLKMVPREGLMAAAYMARNPDMVRAIHKYTGQKAISINGFSYFFNKGGSEMYRAALECGLDPNSISIPHMLYRDLDLLKIYLRSKPSSENVQRLMDDVPVLAAETRINDMDHVAGYTALLIAAGADLPWDIRNTYYGQIAYYSYGMLRHAFLAFGFALDDAVRLPNELRLKIALNMLGMDY